MNPIAQELNKIISVEEDKTLADLYLLLFHTGLRRNEALFLDWDDVNLEIKTIKVRNKDGFTTKNQKERTIPINDTVYNLLTSIENNSDYVFNKDGERLNSFFVSKRFKRCVRILNLDERIHLHSLRHSFASNLAQRGVNLYVIQKLLGHSKITTTQIYSHLRTEDLVKAINELN